jgi:hypothetical protein
MRLADVESRRIEIFSKMMNVKKKKGKGKGKGGAKGAKGGKKK